MIKILHSLFYLFLGSRSAKFYLKIRTGSQVILTLFLGFGRPPSLDSKKTGRIKNELINQRGSDVIFASHQNIVANFLCNSDRSETSSRIFFGVYNPKMPPRRCVVQYCSRVSDKVLGISMHASPSSYCGLGWSHHCKVNTLFANSYLSQLV